MFIASGGFSLTVSVKHLDVLYSMNTSSHAKTHKNKPEGKQVVMQDICPGSSFVFVFITFRPRDSFTVGSFYSYTAKESVNLLATVVSTRHLNATFFSHEIHFYSDVDDGIWMG